MANILIIDDDELICETLTDKLKRMGHSAVSAHSLKDGLKEAFKKPLDVVFLDVKMPDGNGLSILPELKQLPSSPEIIIITGQGDPDGAELAIKSGAWDYIEKISSIKEMVLPLIRALQYREEKARQLPIALKRKNIIGNSPKMTACFDLLAQAANSNVNVLITGETGTGKELFARAIHENSSRANKNFVVVDCAALPETLTESVLFGHEKGAFTGADKAHEGMIGQANKGTLFLDEVGELPLAVQKAFLRVLEERRFRPVGSKQEIKSDFRLVVATNRNLDDMVKHGQFRSDLLFRIRSFVIDLPLLRDRPEDIKELTMYYIDKLCDRYGTATKGFSPDFFDALRVYGWPGNVRELFHTLERVFAIARNAPMLFCKHLPDEIRIQVARTSVGGAFTTRSLKGKTDASKVPPAWRDFRENTEKGYVQKLISFTRGDIKQASQISRLSRARLYQLLKKYGI